MFNFDKTIMLNKRSYKSVDYILMLPIQKEYPYG